MLPLLSRVTDPLLPLFNPFVCASGLRLGGTYDKGECSVYRVERVLFPLWVVFTRIRG